jgi:hypothetical protein
MTYDEAKFKVQEAKNALRHYTLQLQSICPHEHSERTIDWFKCDDCGLKVFEEDNRELFRLLTMK